MKRIIVSAEVKFATTALTRKIPVNGKWIELDQSEKQYINLLSQANPALLHPGYNHPIFDISHEKYPIFPSEGQYVILEIKESENGYEDPNVLWVTIEAFDEMIGKMEKMPLYRVLEPNIKDPKKRISWRGRDLEMLKRHFSDPIMSYFLRMGIITNTLLLQTVKKEGKKVWVTIPNPNSFFLLFGETAKSHNRVQ